METLQNASTNDISNFNEIFTSLQSVDWSDLEVVSEAVSSCLRRLAAQPRLISRLIDNAAIDSALSEMCEHYDLLDKIVLCATPLFRIRLHVFLPGYFDRPHNHRWSYSSLILKGRYRHVLYGADNDLTDTIDVSSLKPVMVRTETAGDFYTLHHSMVHAVTAEPYTVSLVVRGASTKERFVVMDRSDNSAWYQYGAANETNEEHLSKAMTPDRFSFITEKLHELQLI